jgi:hypothetical protein
LELRATDVKYRFVTKKTADNLEKVGTSSQDRQFHRLIIASAYGVRDQTL